jgi:hypothetical protein
MNILPYALRNFQGHPKDYLGPNYKTVVNFYHCTEDGKIKIKPGMRFPSVERENPDYYNFLRQEVTKVISGDVRSNLHWYWYPVVWELICMHNLFDQGRELLFIQCIEEV